MSVTLEQQLREYTAAVSREQAPVSADEAQLLVSAVRQLPEAPVSGRTLVGFRTAIAAAAVVLVAITVGVLLLSPRGADSPPVTEPPFVTTTALTSSTSTVPGSAGAAVVEYGAPGWTWSSVELNESKWGAWGRLASGDVLQVTSFGLDGYCDDGPDGRGFQACDWSDPDTRANRRDPSSDVILSLLSPGGTSSTVVVEGMGALGDGTLHDGVYVTDASAGEVDGAEPWDIWMTRDGVTWDVRPVETGSAHGLIHGDFVFDGDLVLSAAPSGAGRPLISASAGPQEPFRPVLEPDDTAGEGLGPRSVNVFNLGEMLYALVDDDFDGQSDEPTVWQSSDGIEWVEVGPATGLESNLNFDDDSERVISVVDGVAIAAWFGRSDEAAGGRTLRVAVSTDGVAWTATAPRDAAGNQIDQQIGPDHIATVMRGPSMWGPNETSGSWMSITIDFESSAILVTQDGTTWYTLPDNPAALRTTYPAMYQQSGTRTIWFAVPPSP